MNVADFINLVFLPVAITALFASVLVVAYALLQGNRINKQMLNQWQKMTEAYFKDAEAMKTVTTELRRDISPGLTGNIANLTQKVETNSQHLENVDKKIETNSSHLDKVDKTLNFWKRYFPWMYVE